MLVRLIEEYRRGDDVRLPGAFLTVEDEEAARLIENGTAVPATTREADLADRRETRS